MSAKTTLELIDDLEKTTLDFLSELTQMERKRGGPPKKKDVIKQTEKTELEAVTGLDETAAVPTPDVEEYRMNHSRRGRCLIFAYSQFMDQNCPERSCAEGDSKACKEAFEGLKFEVQVFKDLTTKDLEVELKKASQLDHSDSDALAVIFMSHGETIDGCEKLITYDGMIDTSDLWSRFALCPSLQGKPKLFFIQACRGGGIEAGVTVCQDSADNISTHQELLVQDGQAFDSPDMLVMQSTFEGMHSLGSEGNGTHGGVFIHFLAEILKEKDGKKDLSELLIEVTRRVGEKYEVHNPEKDSHEAKQIPQTKSTLSKRITLTMA